MMLSMLTVLKTNFCIQIWPSQTSTRPLCTQCWGSVHKTVYNLLVGLVVVAEICTVLVALTARGASPSTAEQHHHHHGCS